MANLFINKTRESALPVPNSDESANKAPHFKSVIPDCKSIVNTLSRRFALQCISYVGHVMFNYSISWFYRQSDIWWGLTDDNNHLRWQEKEYLSANDQPFMSAASMKLN